MWFRSESDGEFRWIAHGCRPVFAADGKYLGRRASNRDITDRMQLHDELQQMARTDSLTGLANRRAFVEVAIAEFERIKRYGADATVLMMDIDHFKKINDIHGHEAGDHALKSFASTLKAVARATDLPARVGGEEFAFLIVNTDLSGAIALAERIRMETEKISTSSPAGEFGFTVSIGVAPIGEGDEDWYDAIRKADRALYQAKHSGRNKVVSWNEIIPV